MKLPLGENIKHYRINKGMTQEELSEYLGVSFQTISKWERAEGYPDIELLPTIANFFGVTLDDLIGLGNLSKQENLERYHLQWKNNKEDGKHKENIQLMKDALKIFPRNSLLMVQLSSSLERCESSEHEKLEFLKESIAVQEMILKISNDIDISNAVRSNICFSYWKIGDLDKAITQAKKLPNVYKTKENTIVKFLEERERVEFSKKAIESIFWQLYFHTTLMTETECYSVNEKLDILDRFIDIGKIMFQEEYSAFVQKHIDDVKSRVKQYKDNLKY